MYGFSLGKKFQRKNLGLEWKKLKWKGFVVQKMKICWNLKRLEMRVLFEEK